MALTSKERKTIRDTLIEGGSVRKAINAFARSRGMRLGKDAYGDNCFFAVDVESAVAENAARRKRNKDPNTCYQTDDEFRRSLARGCSYFGWEYKTGDYDSNIAWDYATICHLYIKGKSVEQIQEQSNIGEYSTAEIRAMIRPLRELALA